MAKLNYGGNVILQICPSCFLPLFLDKVKFNTPTQVQHTHLNDTPTPLLPTEC